MSTQTVVMLNLPEDTYRRFQSLANEMQESIEELLFQSIQGNLPPSVEDLPTELQDEIGTSLQKLSSQSLWEIVKEAFTPDAWTRHQELLEKNQEETLSNAESTELDTLQLQMDNSVMRRSYALALLKWRGYTIPSLQPSLHPTGNN